MTRQEEIQQAAYGQFCNDSSVTFGLLCKAFERGAKWADEHPNKNNVYTKQELYDMGFTFDLNSNIATPKETEEVFKEYCHYLKSELIEKACKWIENNFRSSQFDSTKIITHFSNMIDVIDDFRKAMED